MKPLLALVALGLTTLIFEEKARQVAGDAHEAYSELLAQANEAKKMLAERVEGQPVMSLWSPVASLTSWRLSSQIEAE